MFPIAKRQALCLQTLKMDGKTGFLSIVSLYTSIKSYRKKQVWNLK